MSRKSKKPKVTAPVTPVAETFTTAQAQQMMDAAAAIGKLEGVAQGASRVLEVQNACPIARILKEVHVEVHKAQKKHRPMNGPHEAYAVILEELDEYWDEVKADRGKQKSARDELIQVAAMAVRALHDTDPR